MKDRHFLPSLKNLHLSKDKLLLILLGGVLLVIISLPVKDAGSSVKENTHETTIAGTEPSYQNGDMQEYACILETRLEEILSVAEGVGRVQVLITLEDSGEVILKSDISENSKIIKDAEGEESSEFTREETAVFAKNGDGSLTPYITDRLYPQISGVLIVAQGAKDAGVTQHIIEAVKAVLGIEANKIKVMKMEG